MKRRDFVKVVGAGALVWPRSIRAQQKPVPVVGYLSGGFPEPAKSFVAAFRKGLRETNYVDGQNVAIEFRWAQGQYDLLPGLAEDLVKRKVDVLAAMGGTPTIIAAKGATSSIPIVFLGGVDLVADGMVASLARPGGNITGISIMAFELNGKRLELLSDLVPKAEHFALLINPSNPTAKRVVEEVQANARAKGLRLNVLNASNEHDIDAAFSDLGRQRESGVIVAADAFFNSRRNQIVALASHQSLPAIYEWREFVAAGGLISYGASQMDLFRQVGVHVGRVLAGANPADLPIEQPTKFELAINMNTAKALGLAVPQSIIARADEIIE